MRQMRAKAVAAALLVLGAWGSAAAEPAAGQPVRAEVLVVLGTTDGTQVDPALDALPALQKAPFDSFTGKKLLSKAALELKLNEATAVELPNGRKLQLVWLGLGEAGRYRVQVSINRPGKQDYLPVMTVAAAAGDPFFVAGQKYQGGTLIIGVRVGTAAKPK